MSKEDGAVPLSVARFEGKEGVFMIICIIREEKLSFFPKRGEREREGFDEKARQGK